MSSGRITVASGARGVLVYGYCGAWGECLETRGDGGALRKTARPQTCGRRLSVQQLLEHRSLPVVTFVLKCVDETLNLVSEPLGIVPQGDANEGRDDREVLHVDSIGPSPDNPDAEVDTSTPSRGRWSGILELYDISETMTHPGRAARWQGQHVVGHAELRFHKSNIRTTIAACRETSGTRADMGTNRRYAESADRQMDQRILQRIAGCSCGDTRSGNVQS